jgi:predicted ATP-binding protein involved in virulence
MIIKQVSVAGLFGKDRPIQLKFHPDINILTGKNGSGKTTIMKLVWYVVSGQIVNALTEINFSAVQIETDQYAIIVVRTGENTCRIRWTSEGKTTDFVDQLDDEFDEFRNAEDIPNRRMRETGTTIFFPTFRRIEGGFSSSETTSRGVLPGRSVPGDLEGAMRSLATKLSSPNHRFVSALSTSDIEVLLLKQYTDSSEAANKVQQEVSANIIAEIKEFKQDKYENTKSELGVSAGAAEQALDNIRSMIEDMERMRENALSQFNAIRQLVLRIFQHSGIKVGRLSLGDAVGSISSDSLSAGEKQMLSFLCYNAFYDNAVVFIDEPELSLHVDWQRQLFPTMFSQKKSNQFIVATHSPFIYSRYPDKEVVLSDDRGDAEN